VGGFFESSRVFWSETFADWVFFPESPWRLILDPDVLLSGPGSLGAGLWLQPTSTAATSNAA
jgi:hypothetical protein